MGETARSSAKEREQFVVHLSNEIQKELLRVPPGMTHRECVARAQPRIDTAYEMYDRAVQASRKMFLAELDALIAQPAPSLGDWLRATEGFLGLGLLPKATAAAERALELKPSSVRASLLCGKILLASGDVDAAVEKCGAFVQAMPDSVADCRLLAQILRSAGRIDDAIRVLEKATTLPGHVNSDVYVDLGISLLATGRVDEALTQFSRRPTLPRLDDGIMLCHLTHEAEQIEHLLGKGIVAPETSDYLAILRRVIEALRIPEKKISDVVLSDSERAIVERSFGPIVHTADCPRMSAPALNPALDVARFESEFRDTGMLAIDDFLSPDALRSLRKYCMESTVWKAGLPGGYIGAFPESGFSPPLLFQIADELAKRFSGMFADHMLLRFWGFKYDQGMLGISTHADPAVVNVNFWLTPDEANRDPECGGLVVWDKPAPEDWSPLEYNKNVARIRRFLRDSGAKPTRYTYRQNRAVIFNSDLFHETDLLDFEPGYENRRINVTLLFGTAKGLRHFV